MDSEEETRLLSHEDAGLDRHKVSWISSHTKILTTTIQIIEEEKDQETSNEEGKMSQKPSSSYSKLHSGISKIEIKGASVSAPGGGSGSPVQICDFDGKIFNSGNVLGGHRRHHIQAQRKMLKQRKKLPGRTDDDNDIKNYWKTRIKRMQRLGLPIYPLEVCQQVRSQENQNMGTLMSGASQHSEISQDGNFVDPELALENYDFSWAYAFSPSGLDIPDSSLFQQPVGPLYNDLIFFGNSAKRPRESDMFNGLDNSSSCMIPKNANYPTEPPLLSFPRNLPLDPNYLFCGDNLHGSHAALNGTLSSLAPIPEAMKPELPSLQYLQTQQGSWDANASPLPALESADTMFQSSPVEQYQSFAVIPDSDGLLESIIYDTRLTRGSNDKDSLLNTTDECMLNVARTEPEWDPNSPFGQSSASVHTVYTPPVSISSVDDRHYMEHTRAGHEMRQEAISQGPPHVGQSQETSSHIDMTTWPDALLDMGWLGNETGDL